MNLEQVKDSCNCLWKWCPHHGTSECKNDAIGFNCGHCDVTHWMGDGSMGKGFRLCLPCVDSLFTFIGGEIPGLMHDLSPYVPKVMQCIEAVLKTYYLYCIEPDEENTGSPKWGWSTPIRDSRALLEFAGLVINKDGRVPKETLERCVEIAKKHKDLIEAFADADLAPILKEETK